jgi:hypothetical protein
MLEDPAWVKWPGGARCAIMMTFDLDGESPWIHRDAALAERPLHMSMGAYGPKTGMPRILDVLDRYAIKTCIFIPGWIVERYPALCEEIVRRGHEVGHHGYLHEKPFFMKSREEEEELLVKSLDIFRRSGGQALGSRSPSADPSPTPWRCSSSTASSITAMRWIRTCPIAMTRPMARWWSSPPPGATTTRRSSCSARCRRWPRHLEPGRRLGDLVGGVRGHVRGGRLLQLARPSADRGPPSRMRVVERLIQRMLGKKDVWWPSPADLAQFWLAQSGPGARA